ncbi:P-loop containing nucleoside triphosphate hydrolase protein [Atractiella rhizophila]|nr:P-loop containing nucleoside triphosphate hydrolase protein [Atractiella rhizophila]
MAAMDLEKGPLESLYEWTDLSYTTKEGKRILHPQKGWVKAGEMLAIIGPSGAGKSTFLDMISKKVSPDPGSVLRYNSSTDFDMRHLSTYVEQDDALLGVLTVRETVRYAAILSNSHRTAKAEIDQLVEETLRGMGLVDVGDNKIGTPISRGISGGQKRRVTIACAIVQRPRILILDEPTSGLDSTTSYEVISALRTLSRELGIITFCTIHQPSYETFSLFDSLLLLSNGSQLFFGPVDNLVPYLEEIGENVPPHANPCDWVLRLVNTDFAGAHADTKGGEGGKIDMHRKWTDSRFNVNAAGRSSGSRTAASDEVEVGAGEGGRKARGNKGGKGFGEAAKNVRVLMERSFKNYMRNLLAYGVRLGMYAGMGILLGTVWVNLAKEDTKINDRLSVHFFSVAFLGFMSVAGIPSFLEERALFIRERANGLYGAASFVVANSIVTLPFLFICSLLFTLISYWSIGLHPGAAAFFRFLGLLFVAVYVAESQSILVASAIPIFVAALAIASFANGFWMCVQGYFIRAVNLPRFWYYWAHFIDYQTYAFDSLVKSDFTGVKFSCQTLLDGSCHCSVPSSLTPGECALMGEDVLKDLDIDGISVGLYGSIMVIIAVVYRVALWGVLVLKKK